MLQTMSSMPLPSTMASIKFRQHPVVSTAGISPEVKATPLCPDISIVAQVAGKPLCISIPGTLMKDQSYEKLVAATLTPLGGKRHRILASPKLRPNSHGIIVQLEGDMVTWVWPKLSPIEDVVRSTTGHWSPVQGAKQEGVLPSYIPCHQFCEIANQGGEAGISDHGLLRLQFQLPLPSKVLTPVGENKCLTKSPLSPVARTFEYSPRGGTPASIFPVPYVIPTSIEECKCLQKPSISPCVSAFQPIRRNVPRGETLAPASQIPDIIQSKCLRTSSLSPLAPAFEYVPSSSPRGETPSLTAHSLYISPTSSSIEESKCLQTSPCSPVIPTHSRRRLRRVPSPRLSRPPNTPAMAARRSRQHTGSGGPVTTPTLLHCVRFAQESLLVKSVHFYPRTPILNKSSLYYSAPEIKRFKQIQHVREKLGQYTLQPSKKWKQMQSVLTTLVCKMRANAAAAATAKGKAAKAAASKKAVATKAAVSKRAATAKAGETAKAVTVKAAAAATKEEAEKKKAISVTTMEASAPMENKAVPAPIHTAALVSSSALEPRLIPPTHVNASVGSAENKVPKSGTVGVGSPPPSNARLHGLIQKDVELLKKVGLQGLVRMKRPRGDFASFDNVHHPARHLLKVLKYRGAPVRFSTEPWSAKKINTSLSRGAHRSCMGHLDFLYDEFEDMIQKGQWLVLPANAVKDWPGLRYSPPGVIPQRGRRPRWIVDYSFWGINEETLPLAALESMQFGHALDRILREILIADPAFGPVQLMKVDLSDGFYRINLNIDDIPKLGVVFPTEPGEEPLVAFPLVLPMGWANSPPIFSTATETVADLANQRLREQVPAPPHPLDDRAEQVVPANPALPQLASPLSTLPLAPKPTYKDALHSTAVDIPHERDPSLPSQTKALAYVDIFVDDFLGLAQEHSNSRRVRKILMHAIDDVFRPLDSRDGPFRRQPTSLKKLDQGDCSWSTIKIILGWIIDTVSMTIQLPPHRIERLAEILSSIPVTQKRTSVRKWHKVLGELRSMSLALPGARTLFSHMQHALTNKLKGRVALHKGVHHALDDFRWILADIENRPTRIAELVPLSGSAEGHHDASGLGAGGVWFPADHLVPREGFKNDPVVWRLKWPQYITDRLVTSENPNGTISNSDLELAGGLLHLEALSQSFDIRERTVLSKTDNLNTLFWQRKGSATTEKVPAHLLRLFGIHQRFHRYVPRHDYLAGPSNPIADALSRDFELSWRELFASLDDYLPANTSCQVWTPTESVVSAVIAALLQKRQQPQALLIAPPEPTPYCHQVATQATLQWPSTPYAKPSSTRYTSYKKSTTEFKLADLTQRAIPSSLDRLKVPYGAIRRRRPIWGPRSA